jgi:2-polyprenyl-3-methyl-5-hydroxy-6-metoxy-1,4-benzoquinol methylase
LPAVSELANPRGADVNLRSAPQMREYEAIADRIAADAPGLVLDWGCGWGQMSDLLLRRGIEVRSFDFRPEIETSGARPLARFPHIEAYIETEDPVSLPYEDGEFGAVLSCGVLEHVARPEDSLGELRRVLRPGGLLYVYKLPNRFSYLEAIARRMGLYYHGKATYDRVYDRRSAESLLRDQGFVVAEFRRTNMLPLTIHGALVTRAADAIWAVNRALARVPALNLAATNLELLAVRR